MNSRIFNAILIAGVIFSFSIGPVSAGGTAYGTECTPVYGGGVECPKAGEFLVDKKVQNPATDVFVDNLTATDPKYRPEQIITFRVTVNNSGDEKIDQIRLKDVFPTVDDKRVIDFMSGPGSYDENTNTLDFAADGVEPGTSRDFEIKGRIVHVALLPDKNVICPEPGNVVEARSGDQSDSDESRFCIEKEMEVTQVPQAGPEAWLLTASTLGASLATGLTLRKLSSRIK